MHAYRKTIIAVIGVVIAWSNTVIQSAPATVTAGEWQAGAVLLATAFGVYGVPNVAKGQGDG